MGTTTTVTLDTNVFPAERLVARAKRLGIAVAAVTVSHREVAGSSIADELRDLSCPVVPSRRPCSATACQKVRNASCAMR